MMLPVRSAIACLLLAFPLQAQMITGTVVDAGGFPVAGVNIDVYDVLTGDPVNALNDGTDINGLFLTTLPGPGVYDVVFLPPPPPATFLLNKTLNDVAVIGVADLKLVQLPGGLLLNGKAVDENNFPVAGVKLVVKDLDSGDVLQLPGATTGVFGTFAFAVPAGNYQVDLDTINALGLTTLAPQRLELSVTQNTPLGLVVLEPGYTVTAHFVNGGGFPIQGVDMDAENRLTGNEVFTPHDNSDGNGDMSVILPRGRFELLLCPLGSPGLVAAEITPANVGSDIDFGTIVLAEGVQLTGTVTDFMGAPVMGADLNLRDQTLGTPVALCQDNTNANGVYSLTVPLGTYEVTVTPPPTALMVPSVVSNVVVAGPTSLDVSVAPSFGNAVAAPPSLPGAAPAGPPAGGISGGPAPVERPGSSGIGSTVD